MVHPRAPPPRRRLAVGSRAGGLGYRPVTQAGFIRVSSNRRVLPDARSPGEAASVLRALTELAGHEVWADDLDLVRAPEASFEPLVGYRQVTDAHLLALAVRHDGRLVTFDTAIAGLADREDRVVVLRL